MQRLANQIGEEFDWYVAITRGGLVPACLLAQITGVTKIDTLCITSYNKQRKQGYIRCIVKGISYLAGQRVLIIDDLVDTGKTMKMAVDFVKQGTVHYSPAHIKTAVIYKKTGSLFEPDYFIEERPPDAWINFPWEVDQCIG